MALKALTVSFQEPALLARLNAENRGGDRDLYRSTRRIERKPRWNTLNQMDQFERTVTDYVRDGGTLNTTASQTDQMAAPQVISPTPVPIGGKWVVTESFRESYTYDGDGERVASTKDGVTTLFTGGVLEDEPGQHWRAYYLFNGQVVAKHTDWQGNVSYPLGDRLGSATSSYNASGGWTGGNEYDPWGGLRVSIGAMQSESHNYTGQLRDSSGLLYYHARYYDPALGRFLSPDTLVPGSGTLTVAPSDPVAADAWRQRGGGPLNPQALNRYAYVLNNPVNATDPTGHANCAAMDVSSGPCTTGGGGGVGPKPPPPAVAQAAGDAVQIVVGAALIAHDVQQPAAEEPNTALEARPSSQSGVANPPWRKLQPYRGKTKTNGQTGKNRRYYEKDYTHGDVEVYDSQGKHLGSMDPDTGKMTKGPKKGRDIDV